MYEHSLKKEVKSKKCYIKKFDMQSPEDVEELNDLITKINNDKTIEEISKQVFCTQTGEVFILFSWKETIKEACSVFKENEGK